MIDVLDVGNSLEIVEPSICCHHGHDKQGVRYPVLGSLVGAKRTLDPNGIGKENASGFDSLVTILIVIYSHKECFGSWPNMDTLHPSHVQ